MMFCQFNSHYSNVFINIYGAFSDRKQGEECGGGQQRLSIPTSQVMKIIQCNNWIAIFFFYAQHKKWLKRRGDGRKQWGLSRLSHFLLIGLISKLKSETLWACHSSLMLSLSAMDTCQKITTFSKSVIFIHSCTHVGGAHSRRQYNSNYCEKHLFIYYSDIWSTRL